MTALQEYNALYWNQIAEEERRRNELYKRNWLYYRGQQKEGLAVKQNQFNDNLVMNLYAYIVDKGVSFLFGKEVGFQIEEGKDTAEEQYLSEVWATNKRMTLLHNIALNGANCGHCFVEISPRDGLPPRLINLDPAIVRPQWDADDLERVLWYKIEYPSLNPRTNKIEYKKRMIEWQEDGTWLITKHIKTESDRTYRQEGPSINWDYPFAPIVDWQNLPAPNEYFGRADIANLAGQDAVNFTASNMQRIIRFHGHPKTIGKGFKADTVSIAPDEMIVLPDKDSDVFNLEMQSDLSASRNFLQDLIDYYMQLNHVPNMNPQKVSIGALSGFALRVLYADLLDQTETKRRLYGDGIEEIDRRVRLLNNMTDLKPTKQMWQSPLPENKKELVDELVIEVDAGFTSKQTAQQELGRDVETEKARIAAERLEGDSLGGQLLRAFNAGNVGG